MKSVVTCGSCNAVLDEDPGIPPEAKPACPVCGSTSRSIAVSVEGIGIGAGLGNVTVSFEVLAASNVLLQAVVLLGDRTDEGHIIESIAPAWSEIARMLCADHSIMYKIDDRKWEELIAGTYKQAGFDDVTLTPGSGDLGRDVIAVKHGYWTVRIIDQVKAFGPHHRVTANDVRALLGVLSADRGASKGIVTTTSDFAPRIEHDDLLKPFIPYRLELINGKKLIHRLSELTRGASGV